MPLFSMMVSSILTIHLRAEMGRIPKVFCHQSQPDVRVEDKCK
jgi:hypothetical protein